MSEEKMQNMQAEQPAEQSAEEIHELIRVKREKLAALQEAGRDPFQIMKYDVTHHTTEIKEKFEALEGTRVSIAGRMMSKRVMGKASFINVQDKLGNIQCYVRKDEVGEESYADFKKLDVGDIIGVSGEVFKTKTGEISVKAKEVVLLSKCLQVLPEKYHGLKDTDMRYRQRYLDLIMNPDVKETFIRRSLIIREIRNFLDGRDFIEVETPVLVPNAGGAAARPFITHHNALDQDIFLRISLELYLKRLIVGGLERVYEIGRVFRNEGLSVRHNPEFTLLELYQAYTDYEGMMELTESLYRTVAQKVLGTTLIHYGDVEIDLSKPFERITMLDAVKKYTGIDFNEVKTEEEAKALAKEHHIAYEERHKKGDILNLFFEEYVEEHLIQPTFVTHIPRELCPLAKLNLKDPTVLDVFELCINGQEIAPAYSEQNDPFIQREMFEAQVGEEKQNLDEDFLNALEYGMPPAGGMGVGIDRLVILLTGASNIRDTILFPSLRPE